MRDPKQKDRSQKFKASLLWHSLDLFMYPCCRHHSGQEGPIKQIGLINSRPVCSGNLWTSSFIYDVDIYHACHYIQNDPNKTDQSQKFKTSLLWTSSCIHDVDISRDMRDQTKQIGFRNSMPVCSGILWTSSFIYAALAFSGPLLSSMM